MYIIYYVSLKPKVCSDGEIPGPWIQVIVDARAKSTQGCFRVLAGVFGDNKHILTVGAQPQTVEAAYLTDIISDADVIQSDEGSVLHIIIGIVLGGEKMTLINIRAGVSEEIQRIQDVLGYPQIGFDIVVDEVADTGSGYERKAPFLVVKRRAETHNDRCKGRMIMIGIRR